MASDKSDLAHAGASARDLHESEERFRLLVSSVKDYAIFMLDPDGVIQTWNTGAERIKGYSATEVIGQHFSLFYPEEDRRAGKPELELALAVEHDRVEDEGWRIRKGGEPFWAYVVITALRDEQNRLTGFGKVTRDLTDQHKREQAERRAALYQEANRLKDDFLAIVSHELRTPLNVVYGSASMLRAGSLSAEAAERTWASMLRNTQLLMQIIDDLLDVSRIISGKLSLQRQPIDVVPILRELVEELRKPAELQGVTLSLALESESAWVNADRGRLRQIVSNLLSNALKFTLEEGRVDVRCATRDGTLEIEVTDTGIGLDPDFVPRLFERFTQADATIQRERGGLGLGLAITRELVSRHGGTVTASSPGPGQGSTFRVVLPLTEPS